MRFRSKSHRDRGPFRLRLVNQSANFLWNPHLLLHSWADWQTSLCSAAELFTARLHYSADAPCSRGRCERPVKTLHPLGQLRRPRARHGPDSQRSQMTKTALPGDPLPFPLLRRHIAPPSVPARRSERTAPIRPAARRIRRGGLGLFRARPDESAAEIPGLAPVHPAPEGAIATQAERIP